jgi:hypothetical protein
MMLIQLKRMLMPAFVAASAAGVFAATMYGQVQTTTSTANGAATQQVKVERGEVVYVSGNTLIVKMEDGTIRDFPNVPESARVTVDGQQLGIHDLKPGMKLERTITTTTTPRVVTTVKTVTGTVWHVSPPNSVILTLEDGTNQQFTIPKNQKFNVNGQMVDAFGLRKGMQISATKIVEVPESVVTQQRTVTGTLPPPPPAPPADAPVLVVYTPHPQPVQTASAEPAPTKLPKTGSIVPLVGLLGLVCLFLSLSLRVTRRS